MLAVSLMIALLIVLLVVSFSSGQSWTMFGGILAAIGCVSSFAFLFLTPQKKDVRVGDVSAFLMISLVLSVLVLLLARFADIRNPDPTALRITGTQGSALVTGANKLAGVLPDENGLSWFLVTVKTPGRYEALELTFVAQESDPATGNCASNIELTLERNLAFLGPADPEAGGAGNTYVTSIDPVPGSSEVELKVQVANREQPDPNCAVNLVVTAGLKKTFFPF